MSDTVPNTFRETAQKLTRIRIAAEEVNPNEVAVGITDDIGGTASRFEIEIGCAALHHELRQVGIDIQLSDLAMFVQTDIDEHQQEALSGYLEIVRGILGVESPKRRWRLFAKAEPAIMKKWLIVRAEQAFSRDDRIVIHGMAKRML